MCQHKWLLCLAAVPLVACLGAIRAAAQASSTDIWLAELKVTKSPRAPGGQSIEIGEPKNVTRRVGYDNQPRFLSDSRSFLYTRDDESSHTDIYRYDIGSKKFSRVTNTPESEYSPTPVARGGGAFYTVRVESDSTQRVWRFESGGSKPRVVLAAIDSVGYFTWVDDRTVALFVVGEPHTLRLVDVETERETLIASDIGRALLRTPRGGGLTLLVREPKSDPAHYAFYTWTEGTRIDFLIDAYGDGQDAVWIGDSLVMADGSMLYRSRPFHSRVWTNIVDLGRYGVTGITRIVVSPDQHWIAMAAAETP